MMGRVDRVEDRRWPRRKRSWVSPPLLVALSLMMGCADACNGCGSGLGKDAAQQLTKSIDHVVDQLPGIIKQIDDLLANNIGQLDATLAHQIQEVNNLLKQNIDGINGALQDTIDNVDAMLAARLDQIFKFASGFLAEIDGIIAHRISQLSFNLQALTRTLEVSGTELLESAGFQVVKTIREGNRVVAVVVGGVVETVIVVGAILVMIACVVIAGIFYIRQRRIRPGVAGRLSGWQLGLGSTFFAFVFGVAALMVFVPSARASVASARVPLSDENTCAEVVPLAAAFVGENRTVHPLAQAKTAEGASLLAGIYQCMAEGSIADLRAKAREYAATIERMIGAATRCSRNEECDAAAGEHCQVATGLCTTRCEAPGQCPVNQVCHSPDTIGMCGPPCSAQRPCTSGLTCKAGECVPPPDTTTTPPPGKGKGKIWFIPGGKLKTLLVTAQLGCPGPLCPIQICASGCGWAQPAPHTKVDTFRAVELQGTTGAARGKLELRKFFDPKLGAGKARVQPVGP